MRLNDLNIAINCLDLFYLFVSKLVAKKFHIHSEPKLAELLHNKRVKSGSY